jgi:hypothetical protein
MIVDIKGILKRSKMGKSIQNIICLAIICISVIAMIVLGAGYLKGHNSSDEASSEVSIAAMKDKEDKVVVSVNTETIQDGLQNMGVLITQEYYFTQVEKYTKEMKLFTFIPSSSEMMYSYDGAVMAGIDFEKIQIEKNDDKKSITVKIPHSGIQAVTIDKDTFQIYSEKDSLWNPIKLEDYNMSLSEFEAAAKEKALENGILDRSDEQAKKLVENFINNFPSLSEYDISYEWRNDDES